MIVPSILVLWEVEFPDNRAGSRLITTSLRGRPQQQDLRCFLHRINLEVYMHIFISSCAMMLYVCEKAVFPILNTKNSVLSSKYNKKVI